MTVEALPNDNRAENTLKELAGWVESYPDDESLTATSAFLEDLVTGWQTGQREATEVMREINQRYWDTDGSVSEVSSTVLIQSSTWFGYEAGLSIDEQTAIEIEVEEANKV